MLRDGVDFTGALSARLAAVDPALAGLLVRPDGHIAATFREETLTLSAVEEALTQVFGLPLMAKEV